jgi:hypothetical protein
MSSARYSVSYFGTLVESLRQVVADDLWRDFVVPPDREHTFDTFTEFLEYAGTTSDELLAVLRSRGEHQLAGQVLGLVNTEPLGQYGTNQHVGVGNTNSQDENDTSYVVARLRRDNPDLAAEVIAGLISPHAAAIQAGIRKPRASVRIDDPKAAVKTLLKHFTRDQLVNALEGT